MSTPSRLTRAHDPHERLEKAIRSLLTASGVSRDAGPEGVEKLVDDLPSGWELHGDLALLPKDAFRDQAWKQLSAYEIEREDDLSGLWRAVADALCVERLARKGEIEGAERRPQAELLFGEDGWVTHREHGIDFSFDVTKSMFSAGNLSERGRVGELSCSGETVLDLYAGIGYYTLPLLMRADAAHIHACEWSADALAALKHNLAANRVSDRCTIHAGDNRDALTDGGSAAGALGACDRVMAGLLPNSKKGWPLALAALKPEGGWLHLHGNSPGGEELQWAEEVLAELKALGERDGRDIRLERLVKVKWYAPHVRHCVLDVRVG